MNSKCFKHQEQPTLSSLPQEGTTGPAAEPPLCQLKPYDGPIMLSVFAICLGASAGALARWGLGLWLSPGGLIPWGTLAANWVGAYLIGMALAVFQALPQLDPAWRLALITGFLGALTTFSSFSAEVVAMLGQQRYLQAIGTTSLHVFGSLLLTVAGLKTATLLIANYP